MGTAQDKSLPVLMRVKKNRVWELDFLRGLAVLCMCFDHLMYDFAYLIYAVFENADKVNNPFIVRIHGLALDYMKSTLSFGFRFWGHYIFVFLFLFLVGVSCSFSRDNIKRGFQLFAVAIAFSAASFIGRELGFLESGIFFGILECIASSILIAAAVDLFTARVKPLNTYLPLLLGAVIILVGVAYGFWDWGRPYEAEFTFSHIPGYVLGTIGFGDDWFGIFPYVGGVLVGLYWGKAAYAQRKSLFPALDGKWNKPFAFVGRHALLFYVAHQIVLAALVIVLCLCLGYRM